MSPPILYKTSMFIIVALFLSACGGSTDQVTQNPNDITEQVLNLTSNNGLSEDLDSGNFIIKIPVNATTDNIELFYIKDNITEQNQSNNIISDSYSLTASISSLLTEYTITIKIPDDYVLGGQLFIARLNGDTWTTLDNSVVSNGFVTTQVSQLGTYAIKMQRKEAFSDIGPTCDINATEQSIRFIHVADLHARFGYKEQYFSRIKGYQQQAKNESPYTLFTNGGDDYEKGTVAEQTSLGLATDEAIKAMAFDIRVLGNHDYAWGPEKLVDFSHDDNAIVLASNTRYEATKIEDFSGVGFAKIQVGCITIGMFGMTSVPWNELDEPIEDDPIPDFIQQFKMSWEWQEIAQSIVSQYSDDVDYMIMLSHLGIGLDTRIATNVPGVDLVLGGHSHGGESYNKLENGSVVIQPNFYAKGLIDVNLTFNTTDKSLSSIDHTMVETESITHIDEKTQTAINTIMGRYAPDAQTEIAISENYPTALELTAIVAKAGQHSTNITAALLAPEQVQKRWTPGALTQEDFHKAFYVERQPSNTSGFNALYKVTVTGTDLTTMLASQPDWFLLEPTEIQAGLDYDVLLFKGAALNPNLFFNAVTFNNTQLIGETWWLLDQYARYRTSQCLHIDTDTRLNACKNTNNITIWNFDDPMNPLEPDLSGPSVLTYFDPEDTGWGETDTSYKTTTELGLADLSDGPSGVMAFSRHSPTEGLLLTLNTLANGDFENEGFVSDYTIVMDLNWPSEEKDEYRAVLQTNTVDYLSDDADISISPDGGYGKTTSSSGYFGNTEPETWHRIALVFYAAPDNGVFKVFIDGELVGVKEEGEINKRWALNKAALLFTDNNYGVSKGYLNALLYAGRTMTSSEIKSLGGPQKKLTFEPDAQQLNQKVEQHYLNAPAIKTNLWQAQRNKFFGSQQN